MASSVSLLLSNVVTPSPLPSLRSHGRRLLHAREGFLTGYCNDRLAFMNGKKDGDEKGGTMMQKKRRGAQIRGGLPLVSSVPVLGPILNTVFSPLVLLAVYAIGGMSNQSLLFSSLPFSSICFVFNYSN